MATSLVPAYPIQLPKGTWDSHVHVIDEDRFPFAPDHKYRPGRASIEDLLAFERGLGVENVCLVAVSVYGFDNQSIVDAMKHLNADCRALASFDADGISEKELERMHAVGIRGVRINLKTKEEAPTREELITRLVSYAKRIQSRRWIMQLYVGLEQIPLIADVIPDLGVRVVIDHMGSPNPAVKAASQPGYRELLELLRKGAIWVKISGSYRFQELPDLDAFAKALIRAGPRNVVWASDWPHTGGPVVQMNGQPISSYRNVDDVAFVRRCFEWCNGEESLIQALFVSNPRRLWLGQEEL